MRYLCITLVLCTTAVGGIIPIAVNQPYYSASSGGTMGPGPGTDVTAVHITGGDAMTADWDFGDGYMLKIDKVRARDGAGLCLYEDGGTGLFVEDGGNVGVGQTNPSYLLDVNGILNVVTSILTPEVTFSDENHSPDAVGELLYDNVIAGMLNGGFVFNDGATTRLLVDVNTIPSTDDYVVTYDADANQFYMKADDDGAPVGATYITQTANSDLTAEQALSALSSGIMRVATTTGVITSLTDSNGIATNVDDETGTGVLVFSTSPTLVTPVLGTITSGVGTSLTALNGANIQNDTIDNNSIDWSDMTDLDTDGVVTWTNLTEGELTDQVITGGDIKNDTIDSADYAAGSIDEEHLNVTNAPGAGEDNYVLTYNHAGTNFTWASAGAGDMLLATYDNAENDYVDGNDTEYAASWNGNPDAPTMNAVYDQIETLGGDMTKAVYDAADNDFVDGNDTALGAGWNGNPDAPTMNIIYDTFGATPGGELGGTWASPTIDDSVSVSSWTLVSPTFTTGITATDLIDSAHYVADSIDNEHINWADITYLSNTGKIVIADNDATNENNVIPFVSDANTDGNEILEADSDFHYNPSTGTVTATAFAGGLTGTVTGNASSATVGTTVTITDNEDTAENNPLVFVAGGDLDGGDLGLESDGTCYYTPSTGVITATGFVGALTGNASTATLAATVTYADNEDTAENNAIVFLPGGDLDGGNLAPEVDGDFHYNPSTGTVTATEFAGGGGSLTGISAAYDDIGDPDAATTINFDDDEAITYGTSEDSAGSFFTIDNNDGDLAANTYLLHLLYSLDDSQDNADYFKCEDAGGVVLTIQEDGNLSTDGYIAVGTAAHETIVVNNVTKEIQFGVHGDDVANKYASYMDRASDTHSPTMIIARARGTHAGPTVVADNDMLGQIGMMGWDGVDMAFGARLFARVHGTPGPNDMPTELVFAVAEDGGATAIEQAMLYDGVFGPNKTNDVDLGTSGLQFKDGYFDGTLYTDDLTVGAAAAMSETDMEKLDGITNGTAAANKAVVLDASLDIATINSLTATTITDGTASLTGGALTGLTTALTVAQGGTGATSLDDGFVLLGSGAGAVTPLDVTTDGGIIIGDGTTDPVVLDVGSSTAITILGTIATGVWQGTAIADTYIDNNITIDLATLATTVTITDNEDTAENNPIVFVAGADPNGGNLGLETDGTCYYTPSTGIITATGFAGALTGNASTVTTNANLTGDVTSTGNATDITESVLGVGGTDTVFPADPGEDLYLMWDDDPGALVWASGSAGGDAWGDAVDADILPTGNDNTYDLGSEAASFADIWWDGTGHGNLTGALTGNATTCTTASAGDAAVDFFGAGVDAVTDATTCTDIEGTGLSITDSTLNWSAASTDLTDTADILYEAELDDLSELTAQIADVSTFITDDIMPDAGTDPDVDAAGELSVDTDGANEPNDVVLRTIDGTGTQVALAQQQKSIQATIITPNDLADATRDLCPIWSNESGMSFVITKIEAWSDTDNTALTIMVRDSVGAGAATVDALNITTDGTNMYYTTETTITAATIAANYLVYIDFDDTDTPGWVKVSICGYFLSDVP